MMSGDERSQEVAGGNLQAWPMTERLESLCDLSVFVVTTRGREAGWASELATLQARRPERSGRRVIMIPEDYDLSRVLDPANGGILGDPPVLISRWASEEDLVNQISDFAGFLNQWGRLPAPLDDRP